MEIKMDPSKDLDQHQQQHSDRSLVTANEAYHHHPNLGGNNLLQQQFDMSATPTNGNKNSSMGSAVFPTVLYQRQEQLDIPEYFQQQPLPNMSGHANTGVGFSMIPTLLHGPHQQEQPAMPTHDFQTFPWDIIPAAPSGLILPKPSLDGVTRSGTSFEKTRKMKDQDPSEIRSLQFKNVNFLMECIARDAQVHLNLSQEFTSLEKRLHMAIKKRKAQCDTIREMQVSLLKTRKPWQTKTTKQQVITKQEAEVSNNHSITERTSDLLSGGLYGEIDMLNNAMIENKALNRQLEMAEVTNAVLEAQLDLTNAKLAALQSGSESGSVDMDENEARTIAVLEKQLAMKKCKIMALRTKITVRNKEFEAVDAGNNKRAEIIGGLNKKLRWTRRPMIRLSLDHEQCFGRLSLHDGHLCGVFSQKLI